VWVTCWSTQPQGRWSSGCLAAWALIEIVLINQRDGEWHKPGRAPLKNDVVLVVFAVLVYLAFLYTHHLLFGPTNLV